MRLTLHIGLPKTATTTMQSSIYPQFPGYLGRPYGRQMQNLWMPTIDTWFSNSDHHRKYLKEWIAWIETCGLTDVLVLEERLLSWPHARSERWPFMDNYNPQVRIGPHPIVFLLRAIRAMSNSNLELNVIISLRNQVDFVGSLYAEMSSKMVSPSQTDFEEKLALVLRDPFLDWASLVEALKEEVGTKNLLINLHEDGMLHNVRRISDFLGWDFDAGEALYRPENVKRVDSSAWRGLDQTIVDQGIAWIKSLNLPTSNLSRFPAARRSSISLVSKIGRFSSRFTVKAAPRIAIDASIAETVRSHLQDSNQSLSMTLKRDLSILGY